MILVKSKLEKMRAHDVVIVYAPALYLTGHAFSCLI